MMNYELRIPSISFLGFLLVLFVFVSSCKVFHKADTKVERYDFSAEELQESDAEITAMIEPYKEQLDAKMNEVIGNASIELTKTLPECTLGNWAADAIFMECQQHTRQLDFAVINYGGLRIKSIAKGNVTVGKIFELMPFDNELVILEVKGEILQELFNSVAVRGGWPMSQHVRCSFNASGEIQELNINGQALDKERTYYVAMSDYIANGGDKCSFFKPLPRRNIGVLFRDGLLNQLKSQTAQGKNMEAEIEGRMMIN